MCAVLSSLKLFISGCIKQSNNEFSDETFYEFPNLSMSLITEDKCCELIEVVVYSLPFEWHTGNFHTKSSQFIMGHLETFMSALIWKRYVRQ